MKITKQFIMDNRTKKGAWTKKQIEALGLEYPPSKGWIKRIEGVEISLWRATEFIDAKSQFAKKKKKQQIEVKPRMVDVELVQALIDETVREMRGLLPGDLGRLITDNINRNLDKIL